MPRFLALVVLVLGHGLVVVPAFAAERTCTPDIAWSDIPSAIRTQIARAAGGEVSPQGGPFNPTDVVRDSTPRARFFGACRDSKSWTIAVERGGIGHHLQVFKFSGNTLADKWTGFVPPDGFAPESLARPDER